MHPLFPYLSFFRKLCFHTFSTIHQLPLSLLTITFIDGLFLRSSSTHWSPISMHVSTCWRQSASKDEYMEFDAMYSSVHVSRTYIQNCNWCHHMVIKNKCETTFKILKIDGSPQVVQIILLTLSINCLADGSFRCGTCLSPVVISIIIKPKLYMSDWVDISPLYKYSGAMYPLH